MPVFIHTWLASSLQLCVGPVAITSLMYGDALTPLFPQIDFENASQDPMIGQYIAVVLQVCSQNHVSHICEAIKGLLLSRRPYIWLVLFDCLTHAAQNPPLRVCVFLQ
jgi:hypothetical protein